ncbi:MAG: alpha/beta hydrolase [Actinomycetota bacterium]|nr:alpha/beta hydrolase [Actinomycetota bacterium]
MRTTDLRRGARTLAAVGLASAVTIRVAELAAIARWRRIPDPASTSAAAEPAAVRQLAVKGGARLRVVEWGVGPPVLLVHGITADWQDWRAVVPHLVESGHRVLAVDLRGHGASTLGRTRPRRARLADDLREVLERLELRDVVIVGHSLGAYVALTLAVSHRTLVRDRVRGLVLVGGTPTMRRVHELATLAGNASSLTPLVQRHRRRGRIMMRLLAFGARPSLAAVDDIRLRWAGCPLPTRVAYARSLAGGALGRRLRHVDVRVLAVCGTRDRIAPPRRSSAIVRRVPQGRLSWVDGAGHVLPRERPAQVAELVAAFARTPA